MRSDLQIQASRANGSKSRGPITEEGKLASSRNALKHGLLSEAVLIYGECEETFHTFNLEFTAALHPTNPIEEDLVNTMAVARWRRMRIWHLEKTTLEIQMEREHGKNPSANYPPDILESLAFTALSDNSRALDLINRYESRYDRQYHRAFRSLRDLRKNPQPTPPAEGPAETDSATDLAPEPAATSGSTPPAVDSPGSDQNATDSAKRTQGPLVGPWHQRPLQGRWRQAAPGPGATSLGFFLQSISKPTPEHSVFRVQGGLAPS
jgi:hypothetical protein